jgi:hypothetical protein
MKLKITEWQIGVARPADWPLGAGPHQSSYRGRASLYCYAGRGTACHLFRSDGRGPRERFARRKTAPAGWHLRRGAYCYEPIGGTE